MIYIGHHTLAGSLSHREVAAEDDGYSRWHTGTNSVPPLLTMEKTCRG